jgi:hypothetical protein
MDGQRLADSGRIKWRYHAMAQGKGKRVSKASPQESQIIAELARLAEVKNPSEQQRGRVKELRKGLAPIRFVRLATQRVPRAMKAIQSIGKLTGSGYMHTEEQAQKILKLLNAELDAVEAKLTGAGSPGAEAFTL